MFYAAAERGLAPAWPQLFSLASLAGIHASEQWQMALRVAAAVGTLAACWWVARCGKSEIRNPKSEFPKQLNPLILVYALSTCYLLLFNPRTENNSYVLLSPVIGVMAAHSYLVARQRIKAVLLTAAAIALIAGHEVCQIITPGAGFVWFGPLTTLLFACGLLWESLRDAPRAFQSVAHPHDSKLPAPQRI